jgi:hypothetical protein
VHRPFAYKNWSLLTFLLAACGSSDDGGGAALLGIYSVQSHTENRMGCAAEGAPATQSAGFFYLKKQSLSGFTYYSATACDSLPECRTSAASDKLVLAAFDFTFDRTKGATELIGGTRTTGFTTNKGLCERPSVSERTFVRTGDAVRIEERTRVGDDYPADKDGFCTTTAGSKATEGKPCSEFVVVTGTFVEPLP